MQEVAAEEHISVARWVVEELEAVVHPLFQGQATQVEAEEGLKIMPVWQDLEDLA
jgi:hypothetical protein